MNKKTFYTELAYVFGILFLALGTALMERADFGLSMVVAPAYIIHLKMSEYLPFFSFGMAEYSLQAVIIVIMMIVLRKCKLSYFFSFVTAVIYGFSLDGIMNTVAFLPGEGIAIRLGLYVTGMLDCAAGVSLLFHTYISPEAYELFVKEVSQKLNADINICKTVYDCTSCVAAILLSFLFFGFGHFEGIKLGTVFGALVNGMMIGLWTRFWEKNWSFKDRFALRKYFE